MPVFKITAPDGTVYKVTGPEGATEAQALEQVKAAHASATPQQQAQGVAPRKNLPTGMQTMANIGGGLIAGAADIGATLLTPIDAAARAMGVQNSFIGRNDRRTATVGALKDAGVETDSLAFGGGRVTSNVAGTLGVGGALAKGAAILPGAQAAAPVIRAIQTAGMKAGGATGVRGLAARTVGGAITGGASAGLVNPEDAGMGAAIGGALPGGLKVAAETGKAVTRGVGNLTANVLGMTTGVGAEPIKEAFKAGATKNQGFLSNIRGEVPLTDVLDDAKRGLEAMRAAKSAQYRSGMVPIKNDQTVLQFSDLDRALLDAKAVTAFKGQVKNERGAAAVQQMQDAIEQWKQLDPAQFHTPEGMDALKQKLAAILEGIPYNERAARLAAGKVHAAAKETINRQAPGYAKVMKDYQTASDQISEIERALSLGNKASADTAMRKLQSLMRNNVQTNYGNRLDLAHTLEQQGGVELLPEIAGQALNSWTPRSLTGQLGSGGAVLGAATLNPLLLAALPFQSPRLVGNALYQAGRLTGGAQQAAGTVAGRVNQNALAALANPDLAPTFYRVAPVLATADR